MVKRQRFSVGQQPLASDLSAIGEHVEQAIGTAFGPFGAENDKLLFDALAPIVTSVSGTIVDITTPSQWVSIGGHTLKSADYVESFDHEGADIWLRVFFVVRRVPITATRSFISVNPDNNVPIVQNAATIVQDLSELDVVYLYTDSLAEDPGTPVIGPNDIGYVELAEVLIDTGVSEVNLTNDNKFTLPASTEVSSAPHAAEHLPDGDDPIDLAALTASTEQSTPGLMPEGALALCYSAITGITSKPDSTFIVHTASGPSAVTGGILVSKIHEIGIRTAPSLETALINGDPSLSVAFRAKNTTNGVSDQASRADHIHSVLDTGYIYSRVTIELAPGLVGQAVPITLPAIYNVVRDRIIQVSIYWQPANIVAGFSKNKIDATYIVNGTRSYGAKAVITGADTLLIQLGLDGFTLLTPAIETVVASWTSPTYSGGLAPLDGTLICEVVAIRHGAV